MANDPGELHVRYHVSGGGVPNQHDAGPSPTAPGHVPLTRPAPPGPGPPRTANRRTRPPCASVTIRRNPRPLLPGDPYFLPLPPRSGPWRDRPSRPSDPDKPARCEATDNLRGVR